MEEQGGRCWALSPTAPESAEGASRETFLLAFTEPARGRCSSPTLASWSARLARCCGVADASRHPGAAPRPSVSEGTRVALWLWVANGDALGV